MKVTIYALNIAGSIDDDHKDTPFNVSFSPPNEKVTTFIGHPRDRRTLSEPAAKKIVVAPDSASLVGILLRWQNGSELKLLTAEEVYSYAKNKLNGFRFEGE